MEKVLWYLTAGTHGGANRARIIRGLEGGTDGNGLVRASHDLRVEPGGTLGDPDVLLVPGGGWTSEAGGVRAVVEDGSLPTAVDGLHAGGATVASVCTGAMVLAEAGLLERDFGAETAAAVETELEHERRGELSR